VSSRVGCLVLLLGLACRVGDDGGSSVTSDGPFDPAPVRTVVDDFPPGLSAPFLDASVRDAPVKPDRETPDRPVDSEDATIVSCSLLAQDCADPMMACYPGPTGPGVCRREGNLSRDSGCFSDDECRRGLLCVDVFGLGQGRICEPICDPLSMMACKPGPACVAFPGSSIGYCPP
jgi:hypothetical protein